MEKLKTEPSVTFTYEVVENGNNQKVMELIHELFELLPGGHENRLIKKIVKEYKLHGFDVMISSVANLRDNSPHSINITFNDFNDYVNEE